MGSSFYLLWVAGWLFSYFTEVDKDGKGELKLKYIADPLCDHQSNEAFRQWNWDPTIFLSILCYVILFYFISFEFYFTLVHLFIYSFYFTFYSVLL